ncbi:MAG: hypothetical protein AB8B80_16260 [Marinicellaceae bacterium]
MNKNNINSKLFVIFLMVFAFSSANGQSVDSSFTYQGELLDNGSPANGEYDINLDLIDGDMNPWGSTSEHSPVEVNNGLFRVNADFGIVKFDGYKDFTVTVSIRKTSEGPGGAFTVLGSQTVQAVPLATNLTNGDATNGQVLTFNGFQWNPADPAAGGSSPWNIDGSDINYTNGNVGIGTVLPSARLDVESPFGYTANFNGGDDMFVFFEENGQGRGYIGSFQTAGGSITDEDFEIGTTGGSSANFHLVTGFNDPRLTIDADGLIGVGQTNPQAKFQVDSVDDTEDPLRVRVAGTSKLWVKGDGSTNLFGDAKQEIDSDGVMKFMVHADCNSTPSIVKSYNGITNSSGSISIAQGSASGSCEITFPTNVSDRYWQVSAVYASASAIPGQRNATCRLDGSNNILRCERYNIGTGNLSGGEIMILVY